MIEFFSFIDFVCDLFSKQSRRAFPLWLAIMGTTVAGIWAIWYFAG